MNGKNKNKPDSANFPQAAEESEKAQNKSPAEKTDDSNWQNDIEKHDYYYDDSHGYEIYDPEKDEENE